MADESSRIKDIDVEASSIAADDFVVIDGATNGSRKLKAMKLAESKNIAPEFSASSGYKFGSLVLKDGQLYRAKELLSAGAWDSTKWESIDIDGAIPNVNHLLIKDDGTKVSSQTNYLIAQDNEQTGTSVIMFSNDAVTLTNDEAVMFGMGGSAVVAANAGKVLAVNADGTGVELITPTIGDIPTKTSELTNDSGYVPIKVKQKSAQSFETPQEVRIVERDEGLVSINALSPGIGGHGPVSAVAINVDAVGSSNAGKALAISSDGSKVELKKFIDKATFTATYNTTTFADTKQAYNDGKVVICRVEDYFDVPVIGVTENCIGFSGLVDSEIQVTFNLKSDDTWTELKVSQFVTEDNVPHGIIDNDITPANAGKVLAVNADGTGVELITPTIGDIPTKTSDLTNDGMGTGQFVVSTEVVGIQVVDELPAEPSDNILYLIRE